jgi:erythrocyte band 7 integral membrane protein
MREQSSSVLDACALVELKDLGCSLLFLALTITGAALIQLNCSNILHFLRCVDLRTGAFDVPPQEILTRDSVTVSVDAVVYYQVSNPLAAICNNDDYNRSTRLLAATTLRSFEEVFDLKRETLTFRNVLGTKNLSEILSERESIGNSMHRSLEAATQPWGVHVDRVEVKDVRLPQQMQRSMAAEAEATRDARAKVCNL